jgi:hypothetical protein
MADFRVIFVFISAHDDICSAWRKIVIFHTKYPNNFRSVSHFFIVVSILMARAGGAPPPPLDPPLYMYFLC